MVFSFSTIVRNVFVDSVFPGVLCCKKRYGGRGMQRRENLGEVFHSFRTNRNISLKQIADANISVSQISRFERGDSDITLGKFLRLLENIG